MAAVGGAKGGHPQRSKGGRKDTIESPQSSFQTPLLGSPRGLPSRGPHRERAVGRLTNPPTPTHPAPPVPGLCQRCARLRV
ncbi:unnamed protein product [Arctogadus glacialis]